MPETCQRMTNETFHRDLNRLRSQIDAVPEQHREMLKAAADQAQAQHECMWGTRGRIENMVADLGLIVEHTKFHLDACRRELREVDPEGRFSL